MRLFIMMSVLVLGVVGSLSGCYHEPYYYGNGYGRVDGRYRHDRADHDRGDRDRHEENDHGRF